MKDKGKTTVKFLGLTVIAMFFFSFALVPLYNVFCEVTGINGKVFQSENSQEFMAEEGRDVAVQFISSNNERMPWVFQPSNEVMGVVTGKYYNATFYVKNTTNKVMTAQAVPSIAPSNAAAHLKKLECFCFEQQELAPGEEALLQVKFLISNELPKQIKNVILSYTIFDITDYNQENLAHLEMQMEKKLMSSQSYYVPDSSRLPIFMAFSLFLLVMGASSTINNLGEEGSNSVYILYVGFISLFATMFVWFRKVVQEHIAGLDSAQLKKSYVYGMSWFIFSEVMFFAAFFGALFYVRAFAVPWLAGLGEKGVGVEAIGLWEGFEATWPVMTTPDAGSAYELAEKSMAFPGWDHALLWLPMWNTIVLLSSSVTVHFAHVGLKNNDRKKFNTWLGATVTLALIFVGLQIAEYYEAYAHYGLTLNSGIYGSTFFMLTGFHGFHVMMGGIMLAIMLLRSVRYNHFEQHDHFGFEAASWYWHFVDVVWVMLFLFVYIL